MFLYKLIYDECLIGFAANKHRWHTWPTSAPQIRLLHWPLLCYRTKQTNYGHSLCTIRSMRKISGHNFPTERSFLHLTLYLSWLLQSLLFLFIPFGTASARGEWKCKLHRVWSIFFMQVQKIQFWGVKSVQFLPQFCHLRPFSGS